MTSTPDPLFREGLNGYRKSAPPSVWERIESGMDRKRRKSMWLKIAAGLVLLIAASTVFWQHDQIDTAETEESVSSQLSAISYQSPDISYQPSAINQPSSVVDNFQFSHSSSIVERSRNMSRQSAVGSREVAMSSSQLAVGSQQLATNSKQSSISNKQLAVSSQQSGSTFHEMQIVSTNEPKEIIAEPIPSNSMERSVNDVVAEPSRTSITYTAEEVNEKFLKKEMTSEATPEKKNTSGLQKVIDKAIDLTNEGSVYGELREKKNEWLTINYPSKKRDTNK